MTDVANIGDVFTRLDAFIGAIQSSNTEDAGQGQGDFLEMWASGIESLVPEFTVDTYAMDEAACGRAAHFLDLLDGEITRTGGVGVDLTSILPEIIAELDTYGPADDDDEHPGGDEAGCIGIPVNFWLFTGRLCLTLPECFFAQLKLDQWGQMWCGQCTDNGCQECYCRRVPLPKWLILIIVGAAAFTLAGPAGTAAALQTLYNLLRARAAALGVIGT